ncbi:MAG: histidinol-phosphate transaminase [Fidelibacterota bacterium]
MPLVPKKIKELAPYKPGKPIHEVQNELGLVKVCKLASNENPLGPSPLAIQALEKALSKVHRYPDANGSLLRSKLAKRFNVKLNNVILGAGSEGIMGTIMRTFLLPEDEIITAAGSFIGFTVLARASGRRIHWVPMRNHRYDLNSMAEHINEYTKVIYLANPDNPMGTYFTVEEFDNFMEKVPFRVLVIMDEAYFEFAHQLNDYPDSMYYRYDNVITLRTFSKAYGLAGLRIGYGFAHEALISNLMKVKVPFEPSSVAQIAAMAALDDNNHLQKTIQLVKDELLFLYAALDKLGITYLQSATNFVTIILDSEIKTSRITQRVLDQGIILRHLKSFGWPKCIRISIGTHDENQKCIDALTTVL